VHRFTSGAAELIKRALSLSIAMAKRWTSPNTFLKNNDEYIDIEMVKMHAEREQTVQ
jgi:hypothetical protein